MHWVRASAVCCSLMRRISIAIVSSELSRLQGAFQSAIFSRLRPPRPINRDREIAPTFGSVREEESPRASREVHNEISLRFAIGSR